MMKFLYFISLLLSLIINHFKVNSVPIRQAIEQQQSVMINKREIGLESKNTKGSVVKENRLADEFSNTTFLSTYLKDLYVNSSYLRLPHPPGNYNVAKTQTIRSYRNQAKNASCGYLKFGMSKTNLDGEKIVHAELRLLQKISIPGNYEVTIHCLSLFNDNNTNSPLGLSFKHTDSSPGWKTFDVISIADHWKQGWANDGLRVTLTKGKRQLSCDGVYSLGEQHNMLDTEPLLVMFTRSHNHNFLSKLLRNKNFQLSKHKKVKRQNHSAVKTLNVACHLQKMEVSNSAISVDNMHLLLPKLFDVGVCVGHCTRLSVKSFSDYASILSLHYYQTRGHDKAPKRCCVPTDFEDIQMLFYDDLTQEYIFIKAPAKATTCSCL